jgi:hypothetical protein
MLGSSALWSQDTAEKSGSATQEAVRQEAPEQQANPDESANNKESATASEKKPTGDFKPSEEISEDFPVPLPSDI